MKKFLTLATVTLMTATGAYAAEFVEVDTNADGYLSFEEVILAMPEFTEDAFKAVDINLDGQVDADEFAAAEL